MSTLSRPRLPSHLKQRIPHGTNFRAVQETISEFRLTTVCEEAKCPNRTHCYGRGTLTFQILGAVCTRACGFCAETFGRPSAPPDAAEPERVVDAARRLNLKHVVITSPARDDLKDDGAAQFAAVVRRFHEALPQVTVEILTPDFRGKEECLDTVFAAKPDIFNHNIETVRRLTPRVRNRATYDRTLFVLERAAAAGLTVKSGIMVGHGETKEELLETFRDLRKAGCRMLTLGQYLAPSSRHLPIQRFYDPAEFDDLKREALECGFSDVAAGALVRSSYHADERIEELKMINTPHLASPTRGEES